MQKVFFYIVPFLFSSVLNAADFSSSKSYSVTNHNKVDQIGVGLTLGSMSGVSGQYWLNNIRAINGAIIAEHGNTAVAVSHIWLFREVFGNTRMSDQFLPYIGVGGIAATGTQSSYFSRDKESFAFGAQVPFGIEFLPGPQRFDVFAELVPTLEIVPQSTGFLVANLGARFYF